MPSSELSSVERTTLNLIRRLRQENVEEVREKLIDITADGVISEDEQIDLQEILNYLDGLIKAAGELRIIGLKAMNGGA